MAFIPFYAVAIGINRNKKIGIRWFSMFVGVLYSYYWLIFLFYTYYTDATIIESNSYLILLILLIIIFLVSFLVSLVGLVLFTLRRQKEVLKIIKNNPTYTVNQIATELALKPSSVEKSIRKLKEKDYLQRVEENGNIKWKVIRNI